MKKLDLPAKQDAVLRYLLQHGKSSAQDIVKAKAATRAQVYTHLTRLQERGLVESDLSGIGFPSGVPVIHFTTTPLGRRLVHVIDLAQEVLEEMEKSDE